LRIAAKIAEQRTPYEQTRAAAYWAIKELRDAVSTGALNLITRERKWLDKLAATVDQLPDREEELMEEMLASPLASRFIPEEYGLNMVPMHGGT
jgi:methanol---5-hydroxybenzimidazolylcobamide Co-methyltransferase